jgi:hypothetical protein
MARYYERDQSKDRGGDDSRRSRRPGRRNPPDTTGLEAIDLKALVNSEATVTVVLNSGEHLTGRVRYYDRACLSLGPSDGGPKIFLRKSSIRYILEGS